MTSITINLPDEQWQKLKEVADSFGITPEELIQTNIEELVKKTDENFKQAAEYVLNKNAELYRRLA